MLTQLSVLRQGGQAKDRSERVALDSSIPVKQKERLAWEMSLLRNWETPKSS